MRHLTPEEELRHRTRAERLRRERMRQHRQRALLVLLLLVVVIGGTAFALRPASMPPRVASTTPTTGVTTGPATKAAADTTGTSTPSKAPGTVTGTGTAAGTTGAGAAQTAVPTTEAASAPVKPAKTALRRLSPAPGVKTIVVDKSDQTVTLYKANGAPVKRFRCASGITYPRIGTYRVYGHRKQSWSLYDDSTFYYFTTFEKSDKGNNIGFHSIPQKPDGSLEGKLGVPVSHGCVRLAKANAAFLYSWAPIGTRVVVRR
jgi:lipoprotein-anchoring transpeptidase ErfK/SrfK